MTIENRLASAKYSLIYRFLPFINALAFALALSKIEGYIYSWILFGIGIIVNLKIILQKASYFYFTDNKNLLFRFYYLHKFKKKLKAIEIPKNTFCKYEITESLFGIRKNLYLYQNLNGKEAEYPPISLTALSKSQIMNLKKNLDRYKK